ncbi:MAG: universal stress protein [Pelovirga sp.]
MAEINRILVATDLSPHAGIAVDRAVNLARQHGATLYLLHAVAEDNSIETIGPTTLQEDIARARRLLHEQLEQFDLGGIDCHVLVETGRDFVTIITTARRLQADLILVGAHGSGFFKDLLFGTTAERVVRKSEIPVLVVKKPATADYQRILLPTDFSAAAAQAIPLALALAPAARFDLVHVYSLWGEGRLSPTAMMDAQHHAAHERIRTQAELQLRQWLEHLGLEGYRHRSHLRPGRPGVLIPQIAGELHCDLVVMGTRGRSLLTCILLGSVAEHVLKLGDCDLLTVRPEGFRFEPV